jgi:ParB-like chromosome segregation protein Spo0J
MTSKAVGSDGIDEVQVINLIKLECRAVDSLISYARNANQHSDAQVAQIAVSIREFGWGAPILIDGASNVIAGHGRLLAARKLGLAEVPVVPMECPTDTHRLALILADNKIGENASWEDKLLGIDLSELKGAGFDLGLTGFSTEEWEALGGADAVATASPNMVSRYSRANFQIHIKNSAGAVASHHGR